MEKINEKWKTIWENREKAQDQALNMTDDRQVFMELKRLDGFDVVDGGLSYEALIGQYNETKKYLFNEEEKYYE